MSSSGTLASANIYRFSSKEIHVLSGMYYYGYRFYDPNLQRWINRDPLQEIGGINLYGFANNNPNLWIDPYGLNLDSCGAWFRNLFKWLWQHTTGDSGKKTLNYDGTFTTKLDDN